MAHRGRGRGAGSVAMVKAFEVYKDYVANMTSKWEHRKKKYKDKKTRVEKIHHDEARSKGRHSIIVVSWLIRLNCVFLYLLLLWW